MPKVVKKAIKPDRFFSNIATFVKEKEVEVKGLTDEEKILARGANTSFWKVLKDYIGEVVESLDLINEMAIDKGSEFEEVGKNTVVISLAKGVIKKIIDRVEDAKEASEKPEEAKKGK